MAPAPAPRAKGPNVPLIAGIGCGCVGLIGVALIGVAALMVAGTDETASVAETDGVAPAVEAEPDFAPPPTSARRYSAADAGREAADVLDMARSGDLTDRRLTLPGGTPCLVFHTPQRIVRRMLIGQDPNSGLEEFSFSPHGKLLVYLHTHGRNHEWLFFDGHDRITQRQTKNGAGPRRKQPIRRSEGRRVLNAANLCLHRFAGTL